MVVEEVPSLISLQNGLSISGEKESKMYCQPGHGYIDDEDLSQGRRSEDYILNKTDGI